MSRLFGNWETPDGNNFFCEWYDDCPPCRDSIRGPCLPGGGFLAICSQARMQAFLPGLDVIYTRIDFPFVVSMKTRLHLRAVSESLQCLEHWLHLFWPACHIHVFDCYVYPPGSSKSQPVPNARMTFHGFCLDAVDDPATGRYTFQSITMALGHESQDITLLKMDIEGWEWFFFQQLAARATAGHDKSDQWRVCE